jgi:hypothetical protein
MMTANVPGGDFSETTCNVPLAGTEALRFSGAFVFAGPDGQRLIISSGVTGGISVDWLT